MFTANNKNYNEHSPYKSIWLWWDENKNTSKIFKCCVTSLHIVKSSKASHVCQGLLWLLNREKCIDLQYKTEKTQCSSQCIQSYKYTICKFKFWKIKAIIVIHCMKLRLSITVIRVPPNYCFKYDIYKHGSDSSFNFFPPALHFPQEHDRQYMHIGTMVEFAFALVGKLDVINKHSFNDFRLRIGENHFFTAQIWALIQFEELWS